MLARAYYASRAFRRLSASTQQMHERAIDRLLLRTTIGPWAVENVNRCQVERIMERLAETPAVANDALRKQRLLMGLAIAKKWRVDDPTSGIAFYELGTVRAWTDAEVATYRARWPRGTPQRTAFALFLFTRHRCTGVAAMSWVELDSLAATDLEAELCSVPRIGAHVLVTQRGEPYSAKGLGNFMAAAIRQAGLPPTCVPDGLRTTLALHAMKKPEGLPVGALQDPRWQTAKHEIAPNG